MPLSDDVPITLALHPLQYRLEKNLRVKQKYEPSKLYFPLIRRKKIPKTDQNGPKWSTNSCFRTFFRASLIQFFLVSSLARSVFTEPYFEGGKLNKETITYMGLVGTYIVRGTCYISLLFPPERSVQWLDENATAQEACLRGCEYLLEKLLVVIFGNESTKGTDRSPIQFLKNGEIVLENCGTNTTRIFQGKPGNRKYQSGPKHRE